MTEELQEIQVACLRMDDGLYAVDIMRIREIIRVPKLAPLPRALPFVEGVINLRGSVIPVVDLRKRFGLPAAENTESARLLILSISGQPLALMVDEVTEMITIPLRELKAPPRGVRIVGGEYMVGLCLVRDVPVMLLNIDALLTFQEKAQLGYLTPQGETTSTTKKSPAC
ncbi:chemotaxis protein CheW [Geomonas sp. Red69]|uniref:Chemotaxis protein CheW n=1 Tax=Geomonas diazotrophica TaxID=2843197 RepID=A0ABX8JIH4_9BACT|nr:MULTISPECIES: chemotaxis protein CheW [Geomonas]MBU5635563.1 chemotaxis protein CheW [Geomonas diazotrophica]QWV98194.1 chemotaxis protein CheW [Geomonas nitrogeniifigens]QXE87323.1 chemotaxis protein CheW [Geomonas nitrogeniifigens]